MTRSASPAPTASRSTRPRPIQLDAALAREEFSPDQLREIAVFLAHYVGWPRAAAFNNLVEERIRSHKGAGSRQDFPGPKR